VLEAREGDEMGEDPPQKGEHKGWVMV